MICKSPIEMIITSWGIGIADPPDGGFHLAIKKQIINK